jgi:hypothetical protein
MAQIDRLWARIEYLGRWAKGCHSVMVRGSLVGSNGRSCQFATLSGIGNFERESFIVSLVAGNRDYLAFAQEFYVLGCAMGILAPKLIACGTSALGYGRQNRPFLFHGREKRIWRLSVGN